MPVPTEMIIGYPKQRLNVVKILTGFATFAEGES